MKSFIFYTIKSVQEHCDTFFCRLCAGLSSFFWTNAFTKKLIFYGTMLLFGLGFMPNSYGQLVGSSAVRANFGVEGDAYANLLQFSNLGLQPLPTEAKGTDDWFVDLTKYPNGTDPVLTGRGVIDQTPIILGKNEDLVRGQSVPNFTMVTSNGTDYLWLDAVYGRDNNNAQGNKDASIFTSTSDKNPDNPITWNLGSGDVPQKDDIIDVMAHLRGEGPFPNADGIRPFTTLWAFAAATLRSTDGDKHIDFEFFRTAVTYTEGDLNFGNTGTKDPITNLYTEGGRTAFTFDANGIDNVLGGAGAADDGSVDQPGTIIVSIDYQNGGTKPDVRIRVWMDETVFNNYNNSAAGRPFNVVPGSFEKGEQSGTFGYARIAAKEGETIINIFGRVNAEGTTLAPPWGTLEGPNAKLFTEYQTYQHVEIGINLTAFGLDKRGGTGSDECSNLLGSLLVKTRSCAGGNNDPFTCEQKDFAGPYPFGLAIEPNVEPLALDPITCLTPPSPTFTLSGTVETPFAGARIDFYGPAVSLTDKGPLLTPTALIPDATTGVVSLAGVPRPAVTGDFVFTAVASSINFPGCKVEKTVSLHVDLTPPEPTCDGTNVSCNGGKDGTASVDVVGSDTKIFTYLWAPGVGTPAIPGDATNKTIIGLAAGTYTVTVTGPNGCTATCSYTVEEPDEVTLATSHTNVSCNGAGDGKLTIDSFDGTGEPSFYLKTGGGDFVSTTKEAIEAASYGPGTYIIKVTYPDGNNVGVCEKTEEEIITQPDAVTLDISSTNVTCNGDADGKLSIDSFSGTGAPTFYLKTGEGNFVEMSELAIEGGSYEPGTYTIKVEYPDGNNPPGSGVCNTAQDETIIQPSVVTLVTSHTNVTCNGATDGKLTIDSFSGTGTALFYLKTGLGDFVSTTKEAIEAASYGPGTYVIKIAYPDGNGNVAACEKTETETITEPDPVTLAASHTDVTCNGAADGKLIIDSFDGTGESSFYLKTGGGDFVSTTKEAIEAASYGPGTYIIKVTYPDGNNVGVCEKTEEEIITQPDAVTLDISSTNVTCNGDADGKLSIDSFSGTGAPTFYLKTGEGNFVEMSELAIEGGSYEPGTYTIKVEYPDGNNPPGSGVCNTAQDETIIQPSVVTLVTSHTNVTCNGATDGKLTIDSFSGTGTALFYLKTGLGDFVSTTKEAIEAASYGPGTYVIKIAYPDGNGNVAACEKTETETITEPDSVTLAASHTDVTCNGAADGKLIIDSFDGTGEPSFYLKTGGGDFVSTTKEAIEAAGYGPGTYIIKVTYPDGNNVGVCEKTETEIIGEPTAVVAAAEHTTIECVGGSSTITVSATGGTGSYMYSIDGENYQAGATFTVTAGTYTVYAKDTDGCIDPDTEIVPEGVVCGYGCTPGFWQGGAGKQLWDGVQPDPIGNFVGFTTTTLLSSVLTDVAGNCGIPADLTMIEAITLGGGNCRKLMRHGVAAILNASTLAEYPLPDGISDVAALKLAIETAVSNCDCEELASKLAANNELSHDLCGTITQTQAQPTITELSTAKTTEDASFTAHPVPFKDQLTVSYDFKYVTDVKIEVFNTLGNVVASSHDASGYLNREVSLNIPYTGQAEVYIVKVTTNRGSSTKKVISSK
jgi:hypothetical protein